MFCILDFDKMTGIHKEFRQTKIMKCTDRHRWVEAFYQNCRNHGLLWSEKQIQRPSGTSTALFIGRAAQDPDKVILFLHGLGDDLLFPQLTFFKHLIATGWAIVTCDIDGHGQGNTSYFRPQDLKSIVSDLFLFLEEHCPGRGRVHLCGYSLGGILMLDHAVHSPERVASLTLLGMPVDQPKAVKPTSEILGLLSKIFWNARKEFGLWGSLPAIGPFKRSKFPIRRDNNLNDHYFTEARAILDLLQPRLSLNVVTFPTLYLAGEWDSFVSSSMPGSPKDLIPKLSSRIQVHILSRTTHFTTLLNPLCGRRVEIFLRSARAQVV